MSKSEAGLRVRRGARFLREEGAKFQLDIGRVDWSKIDLTSGDMCVLAQANTDDGHSSLYSQSPFGRARQRIYAALGASVFISDWVAEHGFSGDRTIGADELTAEWRRLMLPWWRRMFA